MNRHNSRDLFLFSGTATLALRLVAGWTYFSAFWRRLVLENKLNPDEAGYIGEKFNHFLPNALGIRPLIEYLVSHPDALWRAMFAFTIIEGIVGLLFMLGLFTRLMSAGVFMLAMGILLGSGWLGTTCLDEWQIGILGIAAGFSVFLSGGGKYALDSYLFRNENIKRRKLNWVASGVLPVRLRKLSVLGLTGSVFILSVALFTNQYFHGGVWGTLHNKSVRPKIEITNPSIGNGALSFTVFRTEGADVYGSFLIGVSLVNEQGRHIFKMDGSKLSRLTSQNITNSYVAKVEPGKHSLVIPLGARARIRLAADGIRDLPPGNYRIILTDISGLEWEKVFVKM